MLGLGLALSIAKKTLGDAIDGLLSTLKGRATYYENGNASKSTIKAIDDADILDKATILLTPTAYSDAKVHSVKTYTGDELVTNGDFLTDVLGWGTDSGAELTWQSDQTCLVETTADNTFAIVQGSVLTSNTKYKVSLRFKPNNIGTFRVRLGGASVSFSTTSFNVNQWNYIEFVGVADNHILEIGSQGGSITQFYIDNISVIDVSSDFDFDRASSATRINSSGLVQDMQSITDPELVLNGDFEELGNEEVTNGGFDTDSDWTLGSGVTISGGKGQCSNTTPYNYALSQNLQLTVNQTYLVSYEILDYDSGEIRVRLGTNMGTTRTSNGVYQEYIVAQSAAFILQTVASSFTGSIDNVSVQQVDPNDRWSLQTGWSIEDSKLVAVAPSSSDVASQAFDFEDGGTYKFTFEISDYSSGDVYISKPYDGSADKVGANGTHTFYYVAGSDNAIEFKSDSSFRGSIDNVSIKHVTFEEDNVDLARISYDSNGDNGHILLEPTSTNLIPYSEDFSDSSWVKNGFGNALSPVVTLDTDISPDGTQNASRIEMDCTSTSSSDYSAIYQQLALDGSSEYTISFYVKSNTSYNQDLLFFSNSSFSTQITAISEWQRVESTFTSNSTNTRNFGLLARGNVQQDVDILIWGAQLEALPYATSYIPNHGTAVGVTRATETLTGSGNSTLINSTEGVLYAEIAGLIDDDSASNSYHRVISVSDDTITNRVELKALNDGTLEFRFDSSSSDIRLYHLSFDFTIFNKIALVWESGRCAAYLNGVKVVEDLTFSTFGSNTLSELSFDSPYDSGSNFFYGKCKALAVFNEALSDTQLTNLTS